MSTTLLSAFYDIDFFCKQTEKSLTNLNLNSMLDKKAVGTPVTTSPSSSFTPGFLRRHSTSNLQALAHPNPSPATVPGNCSPKFTGINSCSSSGGSSSYSNLKEPSGGGGSAGTTALLNKENKFRDRSFSENGDRSQHLMQLQQQQQQKSGGGSQINSTRYKTELCRPFEESGTCKYGEKCQFAHGFHELRSLTRHPKYKTELCRTFHTIGFCPYGPRCHFIHNAEERRPSPSGGAGGSGGDLRAFSPREALHLGFAAHPREPRPKLHHSLSFSGFSSAHHQHPGGLESPLLESPTSRTPPPASSCSSSTSSSSSSCSSSASSSSCSSSTSSSSSSSAAAPSCCSPTAAAAAAAAALLYGAGGGGEDLLSPAPCAACANNAFAPFSGQELSNLITPLAIHTHNFAVAAAYYRSQQQQQQHPPTAPHPTAAAAAAAA
ncbi:mRNA decay activator protein ZFP36L2, partial [Gracilinanus agilis]|uniref:mRNA decay activator protein ZFP36L2 n=1 Tax=Gracilinanus agilis TaxID=191870 RepID=UPI001CFE4989